jgi:hypothetical protein
MTGRREQLAEQGHRVHGCSMARRTDTSCAAGVPQAGRAPCLEAGRSDEKTPAFAGVSHRG